MCCGPRVLRLSYANVSQASVVSPNGAGGSTTATALLNLCFSTFAPHVLPWRGHIENYLCLDSEGASGPDAHHGWTCNHLSHAFLGLNPDRLQGRMRDVTPRRVPGLCRAGRRRKRPSRRSCSPRRPRPQRSSPSPTNTRQHGSSRKRQPATSTRTFSTSPSPRAQCSKLCPGCATTLYTKSSFPKNIKNRSGCQGLSVNEMWCNRY